MKKVETNVSVAVPSAQVIEAFLDHEMLKGWWGVEHAFTSKRPGDPYVLTWQVSASGFGYVSTGIVERCSASELTIANMMYLNPEKQILGPMQLEVFCKDHPTGTEATIRQSGYQQGGDWDWYYQAVVEAWPMAAKQLKEYLERNL